ncbi:hypothetical protein [Mycobacterium tilburgii]|uniref:hypothetical protein n=1 Tax=Mycobacterium tilburgii TaxID=44467 RepID=UPI00118342BC|nr:hypothetical protein [Mycobacterium tilburgii]
MPMERTRTVKVATALRGAVVVITTAAATSLVPVLVGHASLGPPVPDADHEAGMYSATPRSPRPSGAQQYASNCAEMAVADVVSEITGRQPTEQQITLVAGKLPSETGSGPIWRPPDNTGIRDLPLLLWH